MRAPAGKNSGRGLLVLRFLLSSLALLFQLLACALGVLLHRALAGAAAGQRLLRLGNEGGSLGQ